MKKKMDLDLVETIIKLKKANPQFAKELAKPKRKWASINLEKLNSVKGDVFIPGKLLSYGKLDSPKKIVAWSASEKALEKINAVKGNFVTIIEEIKKNPELKKLELMK